VTLIVAALTPRVVAMVSDRQLTNPNGTIFSSTANKTIVVGTSDGRFATAYTGLGRIDGKLTDEWLMDLFTSWTKERPSIPALSEKLTRALTTSVSTQRVTDQRLTIIFGGFREYTPFLAMHSNFEAPGTEPVAKARPAFARYIAYGPPAQGNPKRGLILAAYGAKSGLQSRVVRKRVGLFHKRRGFHSSNPEDIIEEVVTWVRIAARDPAVGHYIGRDCLGVIVPSDPAISMSTVYYGTSGAVAYGPPMILCAGPVLGRFGPTNYSPGLRIEVGGPGVPIPPNVLAAAIQQFKERQAGNAPACMPKPEELEMEGNGPNAPA
jgi:hypothetical protein